VRVNSSAASYTEIVKKCARRILAGLFSDLANPVGMPIVLALRRASHWILPVPATAAMTIPGASSPARLDRRGTRFGNGVFCAYGFGEKWEGLLWSRARLCFYAANP